MKGAHKFTIVRTLLRLDRSLSRLLLDQIHFIMSTIMAGVNAWRLTDVQMQRFPLMKYLECILMLLITFVVSNVVMVVAPSI